jgi:hypothetical protein
MTEAEERLDDFVSRGELMKLEERFVNNEKMLLERVDRLENRLNISPDTFESDN